MATHLCHERPCLRGAFERARLRAPDQVLDIRVQRVNDIDVETLNWTIDEADVDIGRAVSRDLVEVADPRSGPPGRHMHACAGGGGLLSAVVGTTPY